jgi:hypothetical protein
MSLLETLNLSREDTIARHYRAATAQLKQIITSDPLVSKVTITAGCISEDVTKEIAYRFNNQGLKSTVNVSGLITRSYYLDVEIPLPESLTHNE